MAPAYLGRCALKRSERDAVHDRARLQMRFELLGRPDGLEFLHQVCGRDHGLLQFANQLDRPGVYQSDVRNFVIGRILHGNFPAAGEQLSQLTVKLFPAGIYLLAPRKRIKCALLNLVYQFSRFASGGDQVKPSPCRHSILSQAEDAASDRVAMVMVVEQPAVNLAGPQFRLDCLDVGHLDGLAPQTGGALSAVRYRRKRSRMSVRPVSPASIQQALRLERKTRPQSRRAWFYCFDPRRF